MSESENSDVRNDEAASVGPNGVRLITNPAYKRIREHAEAFRRIGSNGRPLGRYGKIFDFLITAKIPADEKWLMICLCLIGDRKNPTKKELAKTAKMSPQNVSELLNSLQVRGMVVFDFLSTDPLNEKVLIHITDPYYWKGVFQSYNIPHNPIIKPHLWESRVLACLDSRINDAHAYSEEDYGYVEAPRLLLDLDIPYRAKLLWLYLASLCTFEHPTESEIAFALDIKSDSARKYLQLLRAKQMICSEDFRFQKTRLLRIHHTVDVGLWRFLIARKSYGWCHIDSIIYTKEVVKDFNCPALRFAKYSVISTDPKREPRRLLNDINRPQMGTSQTPNGNLADPKREPRRPQTGTSQTPNGNLGRGSESLAPSAIQGAKIAGETVLSETAINETSGCVKQSGRAPIHQFEVGGSAFDLDPTRADFEYTLLELVKKTVEPAFTYRYRNGKTHIPGPDSYRTIQVLAAGFIDEHGPNKLADFGTWLSALRENRGERILLENWSSLVSRWASGESPEHPDIIEQRAEEARRSTEEFQRDLAAVEAEKEARRLAEEAQIQKAKELREARDQAILGLDFQEVLTRCLATRRMGTWNRKKAVSGGSIEALVRLSRENVEFRSVFDQVLQEMLPDYLATPPMQAFAVFSEVTF